MKHRISEQLSGMDPDTEFERMMYLLQCYEFPWDYEKALEFALFRTYAVPSISGLLQQTGEFERRPGKRYDDTELILYEITENGFDSERGRAALKRMNQMHARFDIANEDFLYVLSTFIFEPIRWIDRFGWRTLRKNEREAVFRFYSELGRHMNITNIPPDLENFEEFNQKYEKEHFQFAESNKVIGEATRDLLLSMLLPRFLRWAGRPFVYSLMDDSLLKCFGFPKPPALFRMVAQTALKFRAKLLRYFPDRDQPRLGTGVKRPTYPDGYEIEDLGTFRNSRCPFSNKED